MSRQLLADDMSEEQTGVYLLMACIVSVFSVLLIVMTLVMSWELWTIPLAVIGILAIWGFHIARLAAEAVYEYFCAGLMMVEFFYYGTHAGCLYDMPVAACILLFMLVLPGKKRLLYLAEAVYALALLYHLLFLHTIRFPMGAQDFMRLLLGAAGTVGAMALSNSLIRSRKKEKKKMRQTAGQLEASNRQNADFLSNVSHELRTPINMVTGISEVALAKELPPELLESMQSIQLAGKRLAGQINDILDYTEIVRNTLVVTDEEYMMSSVVNDIITTTVSKYGQSLELVVDFDPKIPSVLIGDSEKISRTIRLLLQNAFKFTKEGGIYLSIGFRQESYGINLDIDICDTGIGMSPSELSHIYDDFYQADSGRSRFAGGLGLGIPIARGLLHAMEGFLHYDAIENQGTQAHLTIPQGVADDTPSMAVPNAKQICAVCYFKQEKYSRNEVREFYDRVILHMAEGLGIEAYRAYHFEDLEKLMHSHTLTHLFIGQEEYEENSPAYEKLGKKLCVVLIAGNDFSCPFDSSLILLRKPFFALPIVNLLNGVTHGTDAAESASAKSPLSFAGFKALVVDDEEMNLVVARGILGSYGIAADICLSGAAAVEQCADTAYDLIFLDHMMPGMDGVETLKRIRGLKDGTCQNLPIIALTANAISGARELFKNEGFTEFVPKPIERSVLERVLRKVLSHPAGNVRSDSSAPSKPSNMPQELQSIGLAAPFAEHLLPLERLQLCGINVELGLSYCGGEEEFYLEMLEMYCLQLPEKRAEIVSLYESENWADYAIKVHALKSTSLTIGAEELSEQAKALELAGKSNDTAYIKNNHPTLLLSYESVCSNITNSIAAAEAGEGGNAL